MTRCNARRLRPASVIVALLFVCLLSTTRDARADEEFCAAIPPSEARVRYRSDGDGEELSLAIPATYRGAHFQFAEIQVDEDPDTFLRFEIAMTRTGRRLSTKLTVPRERAALSFRVIYSGKKCLRELKVDLGHR